MKQIGRWLLLASVLITPIAASRNAQAITGDVTQTNSMFGFFDDSSGTRDVTFLASDFPGSATIIDDVDVSISFAKSDDESFVASGGVFGPGTPFHNEIEFVLTSPAGTSLTLISNDSDTEIVAGDSFETFSTGVAFFDGTILFDQSAATPVDIDPDFPTAGVVRPDDDTLGSLDDFNGESALGTWTLFIEDDVGADGLSFYEFSVTIVAVPEPAGVLLLACAAGGLPWRWRR